MKADPTVSIPVPEVDVDESKGREVGGEDRVSLPPPLDGDGKDTAGSIAPPIPSVDAIAASEDPSDAQRDRAKAGSVSRRELDDSRSVSSATTSAGLSLTGNSSALSVPAVTPVPPAPASANLSDPIAVPPSTSGLPPRNSASLHSAPPPPPVPPTTSTRPMSVSLMPTPEVIAEVWNICEKTGDLSALEALVSGTPSLDLCLKDLKDWDRWSPLQRACYSGHASVVRYLLDRGCRVDDVDGRGHTALHKASWFGDCAIVELSLIHI